MKQSGIIYFLTHIIITQRMADKKYRKNKYKYGSTRKAAARTRRLRKMRRFFRLLTSVIVLLLLAAVTIWMLRDSARKENYAREQVMLSSPGEVPDAPVRVWFLDVGEADAALVQCDGKAMLIDAGNVEDGPFVAEFLQQRGVRSLEYIVATHPHEDHVGGIGSILGKIPVGTLLSPVDEMPARDASEGNEDTSSQQLNISAYSVLRRQLRQNRISVSIPAPGSHYALGNADIEILGPVSSETDNLNDLSIVLRIVYGNVSFLFTGDAEYQELQDITESGAVLSSDVLKVAHHGSTDAANFSFLEAVSPSCAVISVGAENEHYHPTEKLLRMLEDVGARILRTDRHGTICVTSDGKTLQYHITADDSAAYESAANTSAVADSAAPASHS